MDRLLASASDPQSSASSNDSLMSPLASASPLSASPFEPITSSLSTHLREVVANLNNIDVCAQHQKVIADDVLGLSKLEQNRVALDRTPFNILETIKQAMAMYEASTRIKKLALSFKSELESRQCFVTGDPFRLKQIITNILSNGEAPPYSTTHMVRARVTHILTCYLSLFIVVLLIFLLLQPSSSPLRVASASYCAGRRRVMSMPMSVSPMNRLMTRKGRRPAHRHRPAQKHCRRSRHRARVSQR